MPAAATLIWVAVGLVLALVMWRIGTSVLVSMTAPVAEPPPPGELRKVNVRYRCSVCGTELKMTMAPDEDPPPPRHCLEDMDVVAPLYD